MRPSPKMFTDTLTILTPGTTAGEFGNAEPDWAAATRTTVQGRISQRGTVENNTAGRTAQSSEWVVYLPGGTSIDAGCRVERDGSVFEVVGAPYAPTSGTGAGHLEVRLLLVEG